MSSFLNTTCFLILILVLVLILVSAAATAHGDDDETTSSSSKPPNLRAKSLILVKIWCLVLVFAGTFIGGMSPCFFKWNDTFLTLGTQFSGGVFLGTALMHFLSDANETFEDLTTTSEYPFAFMLASAGYLLTMLADCVIKAVYIKRDINTGQKKKKKKTTGTSSSPLEQLELDVNDHHPPQPKQVGGGASLVISSIVGDTVLLIVALCFHSVFEGIAIGVAETAADAWKALWTISLHKIFAAVAMSIALLNMVPQRPLLSCAAYAFAFAISSPIGIAIGILIDQTAQGHVADWIFAISMGLTCGVFVYVSINHLLIISNNHHHQHHKLHNHKEEQDQDHSSSSSSVNALYARFFAVLLGVGVIAIVMIWDT